MPFQFFSQLWKKAVTIFPIVAITLTTLFSVLLLALRDHRSIGQFRDFCLANPGTVSFLKQIIAGLLGALWTYVAVACFNYTTRVRFATTARKPTLQTLNLWAAVSVQRIDFSLSFSYLVLTAVVILVAHTVGSLWAGAIAPIATVANSTTRNDLCADAVVPIYSFDPPWSNLEFPVKNSPTDFNDDVSKTCQEVTGDYGYITTCPVPNQQGLILNSGRSATTWDGKPRIHSKNDNPSWSYLGRSYGMGSSTGVVPLPNGTGTLLAYSYQEQGYFVDTKCDFNPDTPFSIESNKTVLFSIPNTDLNLTAYFASGMLPGSNEVNITSIQNNQVCFNGVLTWAASSQGTQSTLFVAANDYYSLYDTMQCDMTWTPTNFNVSVNTTDRTIAVQRLGLGDRSTFDGDGYLMQNTISSLGLLAQTASSVAYSSVGESLVTNWQTQYNRTFEQNQNVTSDLVQKRAAQDSFNAMLDDILVSLGAAQVWFGPQNTTQGDSTRPVPASLTYSAIRIGDDRYIYATLGINIIILIIAIEEIIRTRNWHHLSLLDYMDLKSVIIAASAGGTAVAEAVGSSYTPGSHWTGDAGSKEAAKTRVRLVVGDDGGGLGPAIVLAGKETEGKDEEETRLV